MEAEGGKHSRVGSGIGFWFRFGFGTGSGNALIPWDGYGIGCPVPFNNIMIGFKEFFFFFFEKR